MVTLLSLSLGPSHDLTRCRTHAVCRYSPSRIYLERVILYFTGKWLERQKRHAPRVDELRIFVSNKLTLDITTFDSNGCGRHRTEWTTLYSCAVPFLARTAGFSKVVGRELKGSGLGVSYKRHCGNPTSRAYTNPWLDALHFQLSSWIIVHHHGSQN